MARGLGMGFAGPPPAFQGNVACMAESWGGEGSAAESLGRAPAQVLVQMLVREVGRLSAFQKPCDGRAPPRARLRLVGLPGGRTPRPLQGCGHRRLFVPLGDGSGADS